MKNTCVIHCNCGAEIISEEKQQEISTMLRQKGADVIEVSDLCAFSVHEKEKLESLSKSYGKKLIVACYPRAIKNMFLQNEVDLTNYEVFNFREKSVSELNEEIPASNGSKGCHEVWKSSLNVPAWFPVIEKSRCIQCGQCARFCVFGVYSFNRKNLEVVNPLACKNNCPACGRTCPTQAIIFPRLKENSVLSGAEPGTMQVKPAAPKKDGLFVMLNERNSVRRNIFKNDVMQLAEEEKRKAIEELKKRSKN